MNRVQEREIAIKVINEEIDNLLDEEENLQMYKKEMIQTPDTSKSRQDLFNVKMKIEDVQSKLRQLFAVENMLKFT
jgi:hypothetical protein